MAFKHRYYQQLSLPTEWGYRAVMFDKDSYWYTQPKPYRSPLWFYCDVRQVVADSAFPSNGVDMVPAFQDWCGTYSYNKAYNSLKGKMGDQSTWGVNVLERQRTIGMIVQRVTQITKFARKLNRFDFWGAAKELGLSKPPNNVARRRAKSFGNAFLEYHFGWEPLVKDIGAAVDTLQHDFDSKRIVGTGQYAIKIPYNSGSGTGRYSQMVEFIDYCKIGAKMRVTNPDLFLANQMGFVNPLSVVWELVPFSFVVDWFVNVGQFLGSMTDFAGLSISSGYTTHYQVIKRTESWQTGLVARYSSTFVRRGYGISGPTLKARPWKGVSPVRAATAISLLVQQLK